MQFGDLVQIFGVEDEYIIFNIMLRSEYRNVASNVEKGDFLKKYFPMLIMTNCWYFNKNMLYNIIYINCKCI